MANLEIFNDVQVQASVGNIVLALDILNDAEFRMWVEQCKSYPNFKPTHFQGAQVSALSSNPWIFPMRDGRTQNRVQQAIDALQQQINRCSPEQIEQLTKSALVSYEELCRFDEIQRAAFKKELLMAEESTQLHSIFGGGTHSVEDFTDLNLAERLTAVRLVGELAKRLASETRGQDSFT